jgi:hypothetical protein
MSASRRVTVLLRLTVSLLALQFLLGIWVNLFGTFPATNSVLTAISYTGDPVLTAHYATAFILLLLAIILTVVSFRTGEPRRIGWLAVGGLLFILLAYESGIEFILSGFSNNTASFSMAVGFIGATAVYGVAQAVALTRAPAAPEPV